MTKDVTTSLRELVEKATNGPWEARPFEEAHPEGDWFLTQGWSNLSADMSKDDATLIAAAVNALPGLLDEIEGLRAQVASNAANGAAALSVMVDQNARALSAEGEVERMRGQLADVISAWTALPSGRHPVGTIERWLVREMKPAIDTARLSIGKGNGEGIPGPVTNADAACSLRETLVPGEEGQL